MTEILPVLTKQAVLNSFPRSIMTNTKYQPLIEDYFEVFAKKILQPVNTDIKYKTHTGDIIVEPSSKYKNYYKKVFNPKQILSPFTAS